LRIGLVRVQEKNRRRIGSARPDEKLGSPWDKTWAKNPLTFLYIKKSQNKVVLI